MQPCLTELLECVCLFLCCFWKAQCTPQTYQQLLWKQNCLQNIAYQRLLSKDLGAGLRGRQARAEAGRSASEHFPSGSPSCSCCIVAANALYLYFREWAYGTFPSNIPWDASQARDTGDQQGMPSCQKWSHLTQSPCLNHFTVTQRWTLEKTENWIFFCICREGRA